MHDHRSLLVPAFLILAVALGAGCSGPVSPASEAPAAADSGPDGSGRPVRFERLGTYSRPVSIRGEEARFWFDQGLLWTYGFNHDEAVRSFREAQRLDPDCAMACWGEALALGPNINAPFESPAEAREAFVASRRALALADRCTPVERALIEALATRYADPNPDDRSALDAAYADAMAEVWRRFPDDPEVGTLLADARMNQRPWDYWTSRYWQRDGEPKPGIQEALDALRAVISRHPDHPGAHHMMIHVCEASPHVELAVASADALVGLAPGAGHLVHMPSHAFVRVGRYADAEQANVLAITADRRYFAKAGPQGVYEFYRAHNHHFLVWAAMYAGRFETALRSARDIVAELPAQLAIDWAPAADPFLPVELHVLLRFGRWDEALAAGEFDERYPYARSFRHYARGIAFAATGRVAEARAEQREFETAAAAVPATLMIMYTPAADVLVIARHMLEGEILYREARYDEAWMALQRAVEAEDGLRYDEPSPWMMPVRHALGALSLEQGLVEQAERAYREDLARHPENGWALHGLAECLERRGAGEEATAVRARFAAAWARSDTPLQHGSCFCRSRLAAGSGAGDTDCCGSPATATPPR
ncbi:MAG: hypothetical protein IPM29_06525 [Planctomycetes bacterium]|nr:hypothetical protein [Planctomycetota bacterium]